MLPATRPPAPLSRTERYFRSAAIVAVLLVGNANAIYTETGIISSQVKPVGAAYKQYSIETDANCTSWLQIIILPTRMTRNEWVTVSDQLNGLPISVGNAGELGIYFQSYLTIKYCNLVNDTDISVQPQTLFGGVGASYVVWYFGCTGTWSYSITTSYIPSQYYNSETNVTISATAGENSNTTSCSLGT